LATVGISCASRPIQNPSEITLLGSRQRHGGTDRWLADRIAAAFISNLVIGFLVGIKMMMAGWSFITQALGSQRHHATSMWPA
jgi:hypothetical protein